MKLHVIFDREGNIVGAARLDTDSPVQVRPVADDKAGHREAEVLVPDEHQRSDLAHICRNLKVDVESTSPRLKARE